MLRVKPNVNYALEVIMMCQRRVINYNKGTTLVGGVNKVGRLYICIGMEGIWGISTLCTHFAVNLILL